MSADERGSAAVELTLVTPVLLVFLLLVVAGGRVTVARSDLDAAAREGARAASLARTASQARNDGESALTRALESRQLSCETPSFDIEVGDLRPGSAVRASVHCDVSFADLTLLPLPAHRSMSASFVEVVDTYRQVG